jgi:hypothetical protein
LANTGDIHAGISAASCDGITPTPSPQEVDIGLVCLLLLPRYFEIATDGEQLRHAFSLSRKPREGTEVGCIARCLGLQTSKHSALHALAIGMLARQMSDPVLRLV